MARIIVTADPVDRARASQVGGPTGGDAAVLLDERVNSVHLCDEHASAQLIERLAWAVNDAEEVQSSR